MKESLFCVKRLLWNPVDAGAGLMPKLLPVLHKIAMEGEREDQREQEKDEMECEGVEDRVAWRRARQELGMIDKNSLVEKFNTR
jgi:hypothetical protein